jgi:hypothetical protein
MQIDADKRQTPNECEKCGILIRLVRADVRSSFASIRVIRGLVFCLSFVELRDLRFFFDRFWYSWGDFCLVTGKKFLARSELS